MEELIPAKKGDYTSSEDLRGRVVTRKSRFRSNRQHSGPDSIMFTALDWVALPLPHRIATQPRTTVKLTNSTDSK